ncbi:MAG: 50S ribosome-binding protein YggL [Thermodesulfobacteriota bacterium]
MKKRLRKKKRVGEFKVFGVPVAIKLAAGTDFVSFIDVFLLDAIEANGCYVSGGGRKERFVGLIELGRKSELPEERLKRISAWLSGSSEVESSAIGKITDAWYGPFDELDSIGEQI